jgi:hypothetical protein
LFLTLAFQSLTLPFTTRYTTPTPCSMAGETDQTLHFPGEPVVDETKNASRVESDDLATSTSVTPRVTVLLITFTKGLIIHQVVWLLKF